MKTTERVLEELVDAIKKQTKEIHGLRMDLYLNQNPLERIKRSIQLGDDPLEEIKKRAQEIDEESE